MKNVRRFGAGGLIISAVLLSACGSMQSGPDTKELATFSDQTENQRRAQIRLQLAIGYYEQGQLAIALDELKQALQSDPDFADAYNVRGLIYMGMGETRLAEESFVRGIKLAPTNPELSNNYGWFLCQNERENQSIPYFEAAIANRHYQSPAKALNNAGACSLKLRDMAAAERYLTRSYQFDPANVDTNVNLAKLNFSRGDYERARFYIGRVTKSDNMSAEILWTAIKIERKMGDKTAENSLATQLRRRFPNSEQFAAYQRGAFNE